MTLPYLGDSRSENRAFRWSATFRNRARARNVRGEGNDARRVSVGSEAGDQPVEDVRRDARAPVEKENVA